MLAYANFIGKRAPGRRSTSVAARRTGSGQRGAADGKPASTGAQVEGAQNGETAIGFTDPTKAAKTGGEE